MVSLTLPGLLCHCQPLRYVKADPHYVIETGEGEILSLSIWESARLAEEANRVVAGWVQEHLGYAVLSIDRRMGTVISSAATGD